MNPFSAEQFGVWVLIAIAVLPAIKTILCWVRGVRTQTEVLPNPLTVQSSRQSPTVSECKIIHTEVNRRVNALEHSTAQLKESFHSALSESEAHHTTRTDSLRREIKEDMRGIHARVGDVLECVMLIKGELQERSRQ
jgi:hypothetical protein